MLRAGKAAAELRIAKEIADKREKDALLAAQDAEDVTKSRDTCWGAVRYRCQQLATNRHADPLWEWYQNPHTWFNSISVSLIVAFRSAQSPRIPARLARVPASAPPAALLAVPSIRAVAAAARGPVAALPVSSACLTLVGGCSVLLAFSDPLESEDSPTNAMVGDVEKVSLAPAPPLLLAH